MAVSSSSSLYIHRLCLTTVVSKLGFSNLNTISSPSPYFTKITQFKRYYSNMVELETLVHSEAASSSTNLVSSEYADLNLTEKMSGDLGHVRIRQHVNPLSSSFAMPATVPDWKDVFKDPTLPLMVDIGSGSGRFLIWLAKRDCSQNYLGLEIRQKLVKRAEYWVEQLGLNNINFIFANASNSFEQLVSSYPGPLTLVSVLCPDPHFKKKHHKRRVVQKLLVDSIVANLKPGGKVFIQSDVLDVALDMRKQFDDMEEHLQHVETSDPSIQCDNEGWLLKNPMEIRTEREIHAKFEGLRIYRRMYQKKN